MIKGDDQKIPPELFENRKIRYVFDGHIHKPQQFKKGNSKVVIVGSVECLNMGEREESKRYAIWEV
ncbi:Calcineurin-like phosphoesterase superfamily domain protein [compost metagenome]